MMPDGSLATSVLNDERAATHARHRHRFASDVSARLKHDPPCDPFVRLLIAQRGELITNGGAVCTGGLDGRRDHHGGVVRERGEAVWIATKLRAKGADEVLDVAPWILCAEGSADVDTFRYRCVGRDASPAVATEEIASDALPTRFPENLEPRAVASGHEDQPRLVLLEPREIGLDLLAIDADGLERCHFAAECAAERIGEPATVAVVLVEDGRLLMAEARRESGEILPVDGIARNDAKEPWRQAGDFRRAGAR